MGHAVATASIQIYRPSPTIAQGGASRFLVGDSDHEISPIGAGDVSVDRERENDVVRAVGDIHLHDVEGAACSRNARINFAHGIADGCDLRMRIKIEKSSEAESHAQGCKAGWFHMPTSKEGFSKPHGLEEYRSRLRFLQGELFLNCSILMGE